MWANMVLKDSPQVTALLYDHVVSVRFIVFTGQFSLNEYKQLSRV